MPNVDLVFSKKTLSPGVMVFAGLLGAAGITLIVFGLQGSRFLLFPLRPGEKMGDLTSPSFRDGELKRVTIGDPIVCASPTVQYEGAGRDVYTYFSVQQRQQGQWVTVYGSGVAGVHVGPPNPGVTSALTRYYLVSDTEDQNIAGTLNGRAYDLHFPIRSLGALPWPGSPLVSPICGAPPVPGPASAVLLVYQNQSLSNDAADADGFSSPTCGSALVNHARKPVFVKEYSNAIRFI